MIILAQGTDTYRLKGFKDKLISEAKKKYGAATEVHAVNCAEEAEPGAALARLAVVSQSDSLFGGFKLILVENALAGAGELKKFLKEQPNLIKSEDLALAVLAPIEMSGRQREISDEQANFLAEVKKIAKLTKEFNSLMPANRVKFLAEEANAKGIKIEPRALELIADLAGSDTWRAVSTLERLSVFKAGETLTAQDVEELTEKPAESRIFGFIDALTDKQLGQALRALAREFAAGTNEFVLIAMIAYQLRTLLTVADYLARGIKESEIIKKAELKPFVVQKAIRQLKRFKKAELQELYVKLAELHEAVRLSPLPAHTLLERFVFKVTFA